METYIFRIHPEGPLMITHEAKLADAAKRMATRVPGFSYEADPAPYTLAGEWAETIRRLAAEHGEELGVEMIMPHLRAIDPEVRLQASRSALGHYAGIEFRFSDDSRALVFGTN